MEKVKIGLIGVGLDTYWRQFKGLKSRLMNYQKEIAVTIESMNAEVINIPIVDNQETARDAINVLTSNKVNAARKSKVDDNTARMQSIKQLGV